MKLWCTWYDIAVLLRPACARLRTFLWLIIVLIGFTIRIDLLGVTSFIRCLGLKPKFYGRLLNLFHTSSLDILKLMRIWVQIVLSYFPLVKFNGRIVLLGDGLKVAKSGKKMPAVKKIFQESESNTKPQYIKGHSLQSVGVLTGNPEKSLFSVPLTSKIHEGLKFSNHKQKTLLEKMIGLLNLLNIHLPYYFVADAYYACQTIIKGITANNNHLVTRVKKNAVAFKPIESKKNTKRRGAPRKYGKKIKLKSLFDKPEKMKKISSPLKDDPLNTFILVRHEELIWRRVGLLVKFVAIIHPHKGKIILLSTDLSLTPEQIITLYSYRFKIEVSFKQALHSVGAYGYHFWMKNMKPISQKQKKQNLHFEDDHYKEAVVKKMDAYHRFIQIAIIAHGLVQYIACVYSELVWRHFSSWIRTIRPGVYPSEMVTMICMRNILPQFLVVKTLKYKVTQFIFKRIDPFMAEGIRLIA